MTELYNLHTDGDEYRITKFIDGEVASSYLLSETECDCPAGHHFTCRHRKMLPAMLAAGICNTHWFWDRETNLACDLNGVLKPIEAEGPLKTEPVVPAGPESDPAPTPPTEPKSDIERWMDIIATTPSSLVIEPKTADEPPRKPWRRI